MAVAPSPSPRGAVRILGRVLVAVGVLVSVGCVWFLLGLASIGENRAPLSKGDAFTQGLWRTALVATPGILIALAGWALVRWDRAARGRSARSRLRWAWVPVALAAWVGAALSLSSVTATPEVPPAPAGTRDLPVVEQRASQTAIDPIASADRAAHPMPAAGLRLAERKLEARLRRNYPGSTSDIACARTYEWHFSCHVEQTAPYGRSSSFSVQGRYSPQTRTVRFDEP
jgi:hypothetical protein